MLMHPTTPPIPTNMKSKFYKIDNIENKYCLSFVLYIELTLLNKLLVNGGGGWNLQLKKKKVN